jgi:hypothetical protein
MKRLVMLCLAALLMLITGCGTAQWHYTNIATGHPIAGGKTIPVYVDWRMPPDQVIGLRYALGAWNHVLNGYMTFKMQATFESEEEGDKLEKQSIDSEDGVVVWAVNSYNKRVSEDEGNIEDGDGVIAFVPDAHNHAVYVLENRISLRSPRWIFLHEFGHILGLYHLKVPSLMWDGADQNKQYDCVDRITMAFVAEANDLPVEHLNYCVTPNR